ncbi:MAG: tol-pal system protein YbgF [Caulobacteraceae bacterium]|nr:tol-pal system protein YbgF [Caulobacteraceae bacterium]
MSIPHSLATPSRAALALALASLTLSLAPAPVLAQTDEPSGPAARTQTASPAPAPDEPPKRRVDRLEREVNEVRSIVLQARATGHPVEIKDAGPDPDMIDLQGKINDLEATIRGQTGQIEALSHDVAQARQDAATAQSAAAALADRLDKLEKQVAGQIPPPPPPPPPAGEAPQAGQAAQADAGDPKAAYAQARQLLLNGDYPAASTAFQAYLDRYPSSANANAARYWLGEIKYVQEDYAGSATALIGAIRGWPQTPWAPDAVVKLAQALVRLNKNPDACSTLIEFDRHYPKATAASKTRAAAVRTQAQCAK